VILITALRGLALGVSRRLLGGAVADPRRFWARQGIQQLVAAVILVIGLVSIWVTPSTDITMGVGLISAGLAFALQQVIISLAAYFVILRGDTFGVGDRITMGGVRGDVIRLGFLKTTIMEMGQPPSVTDTDPAVWVNSRQYAGRPVTFTNGVIFREQVYNYTREFPYLWEEIVLPIAYTAGRSEAERVWRITDNWLELSLRFVVPHRGVREVKDRMTRDILVGLDTVGDRHCVGDPRHRREAHAPCRRRAGTTVTEDHVAQPIWWR